ncbi:unnamed protein product [Phyllotreta striolata]|uniref:Uncharacterized protein n=1 Tax=Phyllotreta striolata TaxID=444603 RepID=A0A9N9XPV6_PHYSR|nr:unnamed protein product [Phyllotreta striolata]
MGLVLSILVTCIGVVELLTLYRNISRHLRDPPRRDDLSAISERYARELGGIPRRPNQEFRKYAEEPPPSLRLNSHEDVEIEFFEELQKSRSPSPRRFLVTEKERSSSPRRFVVTEERSSEALNDLPEFLIEEDKCAEKSASKPRYILKERANEESPIPLPRQFIVSEDVINTIVFNETDFEVPETPETSASSFLLIDTPSVPRNSICNELVEEPLRSFEPIRGEKVDVILENTNYNTTQYWTNKVLVVPSAPSRSRSVSPDKHYTDALEGQDVVRLNEKYLDDLDGVSRTKSISRRSRRSIKRRNAEKSLNSVDKTSEILKNAAEELEKVSSRDELQPGTSSSGSKTGEPFWVK